MPTANRRGSSLIELIFALVALELAGMLALAAALGVGRVRRHNALASRLDLARRDSTLSAAAQPSCAGAASASLLTLSYQATPVRPALTTWVRCGR